MSSSDPIRELQGRGVLAALGDAQLRRLLTHAQELQLSAGATLFHQDDVADRFYVLREGAVQIGVPAINGPELEVQHLGPGDVIGWSWLIEPYRWAFDARVTRDARLLAFDGPKIIAECERDPALGYALFKVFTALMSTRLQAARARMMESWAPPGWA
jgi:CRP-like cAMP-binding protein